MAAASASGDALRSFVVFAESVWEGTPPTAVVEEEQAVARRTATLGADFLRALARVPTKRMEEVLKRSMEEDVSAEVLEELRRAKGRAGLPDDNRARSSLLALDQSPEGELSARLGSVAFSVRKLRATDADGEDFAAHPLADFCACAVRAMLKAPSRKIYVSALKAVPGDVPLQLPVPAQRGVPWGHDLFVTVLRCRKAPKQVGGSVAAAVAKSVRFFQGMRLVPHSGFYLLQVSSSRSVLTSQFLSDSRWRCGLARDFLARHGIEVHGNELRLPEDGGQVVLLLFTFIRGHHEGIKTFVHQAVERVLAGYGPVKSSSHEVAEPGPRERVDAVDLGAGIDGWVRRRALRLAVAVALYPSAGVPLGVVTRVDQGRQAEWAPERESPGCSKMRTTNVLGVLQLAGLEIHTSSAPVAVRCDGGTREGVLAGAGPEELLAAALELARATDGRFSAATLLARSGRVDAYRLLADPLACDGRSGASPLYAALWAKRVHMALFLIHEVRVDLAELCAMPAVRDEELAFAHEGVALLNHLQSRRGQQRVPCGVDLELVRVRNFGGVAYCADCSCAVSQHAEALQVKKADLGRGDANVAERLCEEAGQYQAQGAHGKALPLFEEALRIRKAALGKKHPEVAATLSSLAALYEVQGEYGKALPLYKEALWMYKAKLGGEGAAVGATLHNLAGLYYAQGEYGKALPLYEEALRIRKVALGDQHADVATTLNSLALLYHAQGEYGKALPLHEEALRIRKAALGDEHPNVAQTQHNLAGLYEAQGEYGKALSLLEEALRIEKEAALGVKNPYVATTMGNMAVLYHKQREYGKALPLYEEALRIRKAALGGEHPDVVMTMNNLAGLYKAQGEYEKALSLCEEALRIKRAALGDKHPAGFATRKPARRG